MKKRITVFGVILLLLISTFVFVEGTNKMFSKENAPKTVKPSEALKVLKGYYATFQCPCCGKPIDTGCCGSATQRKAYLDDLLLEDLEEDEVMYRMAKRFGFEVLKDPAKQQEVKEYITSKAPDNPPKIEIDNPRYDLGTISQSEGIVTTTFTITNAGGSDLIIENMDTSCGCTSASLIYKGQEGPKFSMSGHGDNPKEYRLTIPPGDSAQLKVYYDPTTHGKQTKPKQKLIREVIIISNDPVDFQKKIRIELTQVP